MKRQINSIILDIKFQSQKGLWLIIFFILLANFLARIYIFYNTRLFYYSDYSSYLSIIDKIASGDHKYLSWGNYLFAISYIGYAAKYLLANLDYFFIFNCLLGTLTSLILYYLIVKVTKMPIAGVITIVLHSIYTEFMVFSSVFYSQIIMVFLLSSLLLLLINYLSARNLLSIFAIGAGIIIAYLLTFFFKPELIYFPHGLLILSLFFFKREIKVFTRLAGLSCAMIISFFIFNNAQIISYPQGNILSNAFVFFGHTDYGGDGGEGAFIYHENKARYDVAFKDYCLKNGISTPTTKNYNTFHWEEIRKFVTKHPVKWVKLQFTKFFRTFGVIPESTSFMVLYTGLFNGRLWLTAIFVVAPVVLIVLLFISFFNYTPIRDLISPSKSSPILKTSSAKQDSDNTILEPKPIHKYFLYLFFYLFLYYLVATVLYGQYQERYRLPLMVVFIVPMIGYFVASSNSTHFLNIFSIKRKGLVFLLFFVVWIYQFTSAISNTERLNNAIESVKVLPKKYE